jgi:hypothetical protein
MAEIRYSAGPRRGPKAVSEALKVALAHVESLADTRPEDDPAKLERMRGPWPHGLPDAGITQSPDLPVKGCGVEREHREAVRLFLESWVIPLLRDSVDALDGKEVTYDSAIRDQRYL